VRRILPSLAIFVAGTLLSAGVFVALRDLEIKNATASFNGVAQERLDALDTNVRLTVNNLVSLGALFDSSPGIDRQGFDRFAKPLLARNQAIQALEWIPRVPQHLRLAYEGNGRRDGLPTFQFTERSDGRIVTAGDRQEYFPVYFVAPSKGNEKALGFDLASDPVRRKALQLSADSGALVATSRIQLVQETAGQYGFLVYRPVYRGGSDPQTVEGRRAALLGFALAVFRVGDIVEGMGNAARSTAGLGLAIFDSSADFGERLLYPKGAHLEGVQDIPPGLRATRLISVGGRTWQLVAYPLSGSFQPEDWSSWIAFLAGLLLSTLITAYIALRHRAEQALQASEGRYRSLVCNIPDVTWTVDSKDNFAYVSPSAERLSGYAIDEILAQGAKLFLASIHPGDLQRVKEGRNNLFLTGQAYDVECRLRRRNGEWRWIRDRSYTTYESDGVLYADGILSDITSRKQVEESLRVQYAIARALAECKGLQEAAPVILKSLCELLGWDCGVMWAVDQDANLLRWVESWHAETLELSGLTALQRTLTFAPGVGIAGEVWNTRQPKWIADITSIDGPMRIAADWGMRTAVSFPVVLGGAVLSVMQLFNQDVEPRNDRVMEMLMAIASQIGPLFDRQRAEEALRQSEERSRLLFATIPQAAYVFDLNTLELLEVNQAAVQQYGYTREELLRMKTTDLRSPEETERLERYLRENLPLHGQGGQWKHRGKDGRLIDADIHFHTLAYGGRRACVVIAQDVTERNRLEVELRHAQKLEAVGELAAGIAHEINTPIQFVGDNIRFLGDAFADLSSLLEKYRGFRECAAHDGTGRELADAVAAIEKEIDIPYLAEEIPKAIGQSLDGVSRVATLVRAMKVFAHPDGKDKAASDVNEALRSTLTVARNELKYVANVETEFGELPLVRCNIGEINQVFLNLLVNAAHAVGEARKKQGKTGSDEKGVIRVRTSREENSVLISISDTGCGIPEPIRDKIFDPFFTTKESGKGTGQGLAIARSVVVDHHAGTLTFTSEVDKGATFCIRLPLDPEGQTAGKKPEKEKSSQSSAV
jgi:PAS domain S-box-containing protein